MNERLARLLKLHGLYCAPADDGDGAGGGGGDGGQADEDDADPEGGEGDGADAADDGDEGEGDGADGEEDDGVVFTLGDAKPEAEEEEDGKPAPQWLKDLRKSNREKDRRIRELEARVASAAPAPSAIVVGEKPKLAEFADAEQIAQYEKDLEAWHDRKRQADAQQRDREQAEEQARTTWQNTLNAYKKAGAELKVKDFTEAEDAARDVLSVTQQGIILQGFEPKRAAALVYVLGKHPSKAKELADIKDPVKFTIAVADLERQVKATPRKAAPAPERKLSSGAVGAGGVVDNQLERLRAAAEKSGDYTQVNAYKRQQKEKQRAAG